MPKTPFQQALGHWYQQHKRPLPWRQSADPYHIWLSEVILQQTRVAQGLPYYQKFIRKYPRVHQLAEAPEQEVMKLWEGLGYYSRARNLQAAARQVMAEHKGEFPAHYKELLQLPGIGDYTASAISSFISGEERAVLDGNVFRVLARYFGLATPINTTAGRKQFAALALQCLDRDDPATYNQAIMEFGALQCTPRKPDCAGCPLRDSCSALANATVDELPQKQKKNYDRQRYFYFLMIEKQGKYLIEERREKDIWRGLQQFPLIEYSEEQPLKTVLDEARQKWHGQDFELLAADPLPRHKLSHQTIHASVLQLRLKQTSEILLPNSRWVKGTALETFAFPRPLRQYLDRNQLTLPFG